MASVHPPQLTELVVLGLDVRCEFEGHMVRRHREWMARCRLDAQLQTGAGAGNQTGGAEFDSYGLMVSLLV